MKRPKLSTIQAKADKAMSLYIRQKYADANGYVACVACGRTHHWTEMDAGHFVPKSRGASVRYIEENVHPECQACNRFDEGHLIGYTRYIIEMYGPGKIDELQAEARIVLSATQKRNLAEQAHAYYTAQLQALKEVA